MKDRLAELEAYGKDDKEAVPNQVQKNQTSKFVGEVLAEVGAINLVIDSIGSKVQAFKELHERMLHSAQVEERDQNEVENLTDEINKSARGVQMQLKRMLENVERRGEESDVSQKMRETHHRTLTQKLVNIMLDYNQSQNDYREGCMNRIRRQLSIAGIQRSPEEVEALIESPENVLNSQIVTDDIAARRALDDVLQRHEQILKLEESIRNIYDLFKDVAYFISTQKMIVTTVVVSALLFLALLLLLAYLKSIDVL